MTRAETEPTKTRRLSVILPASDFDILLKLSKRRGTTITEVLRQSISTEEFFQEALDRGDKILLDTPNESKNTEVVLRNMM